jgi:glyoxylase-like metal-dependent hydrolase (beta-lactamase superfamily II)/ferredoxin
MAKSERARPENIFGNFYVDNSCIDCDTCRILAPEVFKSEGDQSAVFFQPDNEESIIKAMQALIACPTSSIGMRTPDQKILEVKKSFPILLDDDVYYCGYHSEKSFGAASYLIKRDDGNVLIDSPRATTALLEKVKELGGAKYIFLTHRDDIADQEFYSKELSAKRIIHSDDAGHKLKNAEIIITGEDTVQLENDILLIPVPGHTRGHVVLLYKDNFLFTGDHLAYSEKRKALYAFRNACWYSWEHQTQSMQKLLNYKFRFVLPGHGRRHKTTTNEEMHSMLEDCVEWMQRVNQ